MAHPKQLPILFASHVPVHPLTHLIQVLLESKAKDGAHASQPEEEQIEHPSEHETWHYWELVIILQSI